VPLASSIVPHSRSSYDHATGTVAMTMPLAGSIVRLEVSRVQCHCIRLIMAVNVNKLIVSRKMLSRRR